MAMDLKWMLSADDKASGVFDKVKSAGVGAAEGITGAFEGAASKFNLITGAFGALAGVAGGMAFKDIISHTVDWELSNAKLANTLGVTTEEASVFSVAMKSVGVDQDTAQSAAMRLSMTMNKNREIFDQIGVSVTNANGSTRDGISVMMDVNKKLLDQNAGFDRNTMALKLYGRGWADIQPLLKATNKVMDESKDTTEKLGLTVHKDGVDAAKAYKIAMIEFSEAAHAVEIQLGSELLPVITEVAKVLGHDVVVAAGLSKAVIQGIKENSDAVAIALTGLAAPAILSGMTALATGIKGISFSMVALEAASLNAQLALAGLFAAAGYMAGQGIDKGMFAMTGVDISGMNKPLADMNEAQRTLEHNTTALNAKLKDLGFTSWEQFEKAEKAGKVAFDSMSGTWKIAADTVDSDIKGMTRELAIYKEVQAAAAALAKGRSDVFMSSLKGQYDKGLVATSTYYEGEKRIALEAAQAKANSAVLAYNKESALIDYLKDKRGADSEEYQNELAKHEKATQEMQTAQLAYAKIYVDSENKIAGALARRDDLYLKIEQAYLDSTGQFVESERLKWELEQRSVEHLRLKADALAGVAGAIQGLADKERQAAVSDITAGQKELQLIHDRIDAMRGLTDKIEEYNGRDKGVVSAEAAIRDEINKKRVFENQLEQARTTGIIADYTYALKMIALEDTRIGQLKQELDLSLREANLKTINNSDQIIVNDLVAKGLNEEAAWLQKKIDLRNLESKIQQDQIDFDRQMAQAIKDQNIELQESLNLSKRIIDERNSAAGNAISDRQTVSTGVSAMGVISTANSGTPGVYWGGFGVNEDRAGSSLPPFRFPNMGPLATGTNYVPSDGYAFLHKGEAVVPAQYNAPGGSSSISLAGGINITVQGGATGAETAREIARKILPELRELQKRYSHN